MNGTQEESVKKQDYFITSLLKVRANAKELKKKRTGGVNYGQVRSKIGKNIKVLDKVNFRKAQEKYMAQTQVDETSSQAGGTINFNGSANVSIGNASPSKGSSPMKSQAFESPKKFSYLKKKNKSFSHTQRYKTPNPQVKQRFQYLDNADQVEQIEEQNEYETTQKAQPGYMKSTQTRDRKMYQPVMELQVPMTSPKKRNKSASPGRYNSSNASRKGDIFSGRSQKSKNSATPSSKNKSPGMPSGSKKEDDARFDVDDFYNLAAVQYPPQPVLIMAKTMCTIFSVNPLMQGNRSDYWSPFRDQMLSNPKQFLDELIEFDKEALSKAQVSQVESLLRSQEMTESKQAAVSKALVLLRMWVEELMIYHRVKHHVMNNLQNQDATATEPKTNKLDTIVSNTEEEKTNSPPMTKKTPGRPSPYRQEPVIQTQ